MEGEDVVPHGLLAAVFQLMEDDCGVMLDCGWEGCEKEDCCAVSISFPRRVQDLRGCLVGRESDW